MANNIQDTEGSNLCNQTCKKCSSGSCVNQSNGEDLFSQCTGVYTCSGFITRLRNVCNGSGVCADIDAAASDCLGTCANYCSSGNCINADTGAGTCIVATNSRVTSGGDGKCTSSVCVAGWSCGGAVVDSRDGKSYATVQIGSQCWMKQGLNIGTRIAGSSNQGTDCSSASAIQKYCYNDTDANCNSNNNPSYPDGGLYQWHQAMCGSTTEGVQGICPDGWHLPTTAEWTTLTTYLGGVSVAGGALKPGGSSGFEGNLAGYRRGPSFSFTDRTARGDFWASTPYSSKHAWYRELHASDATVFRSYALRQRSYTVRCIKN